MRSRPSRYCHPMSTNATTGSRLRMPLAPDSDPNRPLAMDWQTYSDTAMSEWYSLLSGDPEEEQVQHFLELHPSMIPGGSGDVGPGGHHGSDMGIVFRRPTLKGSGRSFEPDFMWVTRSSGLITPILIEIEKPSKRWFKKSGRPTSKFTDAHDQLNDWRAWFADDANKAIFRKTFLFLGDQYENRPLEPQYLLIYGRQREFEWGGIHADPDGLRRKRDSQRRAAEHFITFDSLRPRHDHASSITASLTATGVRPYAFSPTYGTSADVGDGALLLGDPAEALQRSVLMSEERKQYLARRWKHGQDTSRRIQQDHEAIYPRQLGRE